MKKFAFFVLALTFFSSACKIRTNTEAQEKRKTENAEENAEFEVARTGKRRT